MPVAANATEFPGFSITINDTKPIWVYVRILVYVLFVTILIMKHLKCRQTNPVDHCGSGMVGAINAPTSGANTFANYQAAAEKLGTNQPQDTHAGGLVGLGASATASAGPVASSSGSGSTGGSGHLAAGGMSLLVSFAIAISLL